MFKVGQKLYAVSGSGREKPYWVTICKIGRKWLHCSRFENYIQMQVDINTLHIICPTYGYQGKCYRSQEEYDKEKAANQAWSDLRQKLNRSKCPDDMTVEKIRSAERILGI